MNETLGVERRGAREEQLVLQSRKERKEKYRAGNRGTTGRSRRDWHLPCELHEAAQGV